MLDTILTNLYVSIPAVVAVTILTFIFADEGQHSRCRGPILGSIFSGIIASALMAYGILNGWWTIEPQGGWGIRSGILFLFSPLVGAAYAALSALGSSFFLVTLNKRASLTTKLVRAALGACLGVMSILPILEFLA